MFTHLQALLEDQDTDKLVAWQDKVKKAHPEFAAKLKFKAGGKKEDNLIYAEVPGMDRCFGVFDTDTLKGEVLEEEQLDEKWNDSGAEDANGRWAKYRDGKLGVGAMAKWLYSSRTHKDGKDAKLKSAYGAISQQQNTSKLISGKQADALRSELKRLYEGIDTDQLEAIAKQLSPAEGYVTMEMFTSGEKAHLLGLVNYTGMRAKQAFTKVLLTAHEKLREEYHDIQKTHRGAKTWQEISAAEKETA